MRSLIIRFADYEGPAYLEELLRKKGFGITFHDSYKMGLKLIDNSHLVFDLIILMGGPQSVYEDSLKSFFEPFKELVLNSYNNPKSKIIGICLGSQVIAEAFGSKVYRGGAGEEVGFGKCKILSKENPIFSGLEGDEVNVFHLHGDTFEIPEKSEHLL
ncbi:MAG: type 1 glutamine amidotransferase, partial [Leptospiraceae bacterium]|nr:type 1 glutamine amidotransferase [Leptospiraceae bacterium]